MKQSTSNSEKDIVGEKKVTESQERKNKNANIDTNANLKQSSESISQKKKNSNSDNGVEQNLTEKPKKKLIRKL